MARPRFWQPCEGITVITVQVHALSEREGGTEQGIVLRRLIQLQRQTARRDCGHVRVYALIMLTLMQYRLPHDLARELGNGNCSGHGKVPFGCSRGCIAKTDWRVRRG
jgi:hypothetical protein